MLMPLAWAWAWLQAALMWMLGVRVALSYYRKSCCVVFCEVVQSKSLSVGAAHVPCV